MPKISSRSSKVGRMLLRREAFTTGSGLSAVTDAPPSVGRLPTEWWPAYHADRSAPGITYVVLSYATPIGWVCEDGRTVIPDESYSRTTRRHQLLISRWL
ncbi:hypothetical protein [Actinomadura rupiterrae]|uniref:hypothetical protein n=1 Tax=Actinomadura rupiterrae TaxID=559627 RepID=UPI0020A3F554|nr:hypothetical protein [Actinomadura rupiterrae]MCP2337503.1 hypothetical protein [Actinomadura rupiterrae]